MRISLSKAPVDLIGVTESTNIVSPNGGSSLEESLLTLLLVGLQWIHKNELFNDLT